MVRVCASKLVRRRRSSVIAHEILARYCLPLYPADARADLPRARTTDANPANNPSVLAHLDEAAAAFVASAPAMFGAELAGTLELDRSDASVHRLSAALTRARRDAWAAQGAPGSPGSVLFNVLLHGAAYVGACVVAGHGGTWGVRRPLWESVVRLKSHAGEGDLAVFHWWLKSLADDALPATGAATAPGGGATLADRYRAYVEVPCTRPETWPVVIGRALESPLPRLKKPSYHTLHQYRVAHLTELRDLGADFPSAERFADLSLQWLDFHVLGGGRLVLMAGASRLGLHLFWVGAGGFEKSAFYPCEAMPEPVVRVKDDRITVMMQVDGEQRVHELLWWGP
jgi:hypothetical protein